MSRWKGIVVHHSADHDDPWVDATDYERWHVEGRGWLDIGYHWVVEEVNDHYYAIQGRPATMQGAHSPGQNSTHLGVCFAGNFETTLMKPEQLIVGAELISSLCVMNDVEPSHISRHCDHRDTACPGALFPFDDLLRMVIGMIGNG